jgi:DNA-binding transcriptional ArsR family regulator
MSIDQLSSVFSALADPTRRAILARLADGDLTVTELRAPFPVSQPAISKHLKVLESAGLISRSRRRTARLSHLEAEPLRDATAWLAGYQAFWDERFDQLDELLERIQQRQTSLPAVHSDQERKVHRGNQPHQRSGRRPVRRRHA